MTSAFQWVFDRASTILINKRAVVAQTQTRDQTVRAISRGGQVWRFEVRLPDGLPWTESRQYIEALDAADRFTEGQVQISNTGYTNWLNAYQGTATSTQGFTASWTQGSNSIQITASPAIFSGYKFRTGDFIQLGSGHCYTVSADVPYNSTSLTVNRPVLDATGSGALAVGPNCTWTLLCTDFPDWTIMRRNQVGWSGAFKFIEVML